MPLSHHPWVRETQRENKKEGGPVRAVYLIRAWRSLADRVSRDIFLVLFPIAALLIGSLWAAIIPLWAVPDEPAHFGYVQRLGERTSINPPTHLSRDIAETFRLAEVERIVFSGNLKQSFTPRSTIGPQEPAIVALSPALRLTDSHGGNPARVYPPGYYVLASLPYRVLSSQDGFTIMFGLRVFSVFLTSLTVLFHYLTLRLFFRDAGMARATTLLIILSPMYMFMGMAVNVDVLLWLVFSVFIYLLARVLTVDRSLRMTLALAGVASIGLWVKQTFLIGILLYLVLVAVLLALRRMSLRASVRHGALFLGIVLLTNSWLYLSGPIETSPLYGGRGTQGASPIGFLTHFFEDWEGYRWALNDTFWGTFGWLDTPISDVLYRITATVSLAATLGLLIYLFLQAARRGHVEPTVIYFALLVVVFAASFFVVNYVLVSAGEHWFFQGRYLFPVIGPIMALFVTGLTWFAGRTLRRLIMVSLVVALLFFHVTVLVGYVIPRYYV